MTDTGLDVVLLAGCPIDGVCSAIPELLGRLELGGVRPGVLCTTRPGFASDGPDHLGRPGIGSRWRRPWALRRPEIGRLLGRAGLLHAFGPEMAEAALSLAEHWGIPYLLSIGEFLPEDARLRVSRRWCRGIVAAGPDLAADLRDHWGLPEGLVTVIPPGIGRPARDPGSSRSARVPVVGSVAESRTVEGLETFLRAASRVIDAGIDVEFVLAAPRGHEPWLRRLAGGLGLVDRITLVGHPVALPAIWGVLDIYCQSSPVPCVGRALTEAMAAGLPIIASDVAGLHDWLIPGETGLVVPPGDPEAMAEAILNLLADPALGHDLGVRARAEIARRCDPDREVDSLSALYRRIASEECRAPALHRPSQARPGETAPRGERLAIP